MTSYHMSNIQKLINPSYKENLELHYGVIISIEVEDYYNGRENIVVIKVDNPRIDYHVVRTVSVYELLSTPKEHLRGIVLLGVEEALDGTKFETTIYTNWEDTEQIITTFKTKNIPTERISGEIMLERTDYWMLEYNHRAVTLDKSLWELEI